MFEWTDVSVINAMQWSHATLFIRSRTRQRPIGLSLPFLGRGSRPWVRRRVRGARHPTRAKGDLSGSCSPQRVSDYSPHALQMLLPSSSLLQRGVVVVPQFVHRKAPKTPPTPPPAAPLPALPTSLPGAGEGAWD